MTKSDRLSPAQDVAIAALLRGCTITEAARQAGVERQTCSRWFNNDPEFIAALNRERQAVWAVLQDQMRSTFVKALSIVEGRLDDPEFAPQAAMELLRLLPRINLMPSGSTNAAEIEEQELLRSVMYVPR